MIKIFLIMFIIFPDRGIDVVMVKMPTSATLADCNHFASIAIKYIKKDKLIYAGCEKGNKR